METEFLVILIIGGVIAGIIGINFARLSAKVRDRKIQREGQAFLIGKKKNMIKLDGEDINVNKFFFKDYDGKFKELNVIPKPLIPTPKTFFMSGVVLAISNLFKRQPKIPSLQTSSVSKPQKERKSRHK